MSDAACVGVDGCRAGWIAVVLVSADTEPRIVSAATFRDLLAEIPRDATIAVDMPIGLPEETGAGGRTPERLIRPHLGARQSSVFSIPARAAVYADDYAESCRLALATSQPSRKVSKQAFYIFPKVREIDAVLREDEAIRKRIVEAHPELAFWRINGDVSMRLPKKMRGRANPAGLDERRLLLTRAGYETDFLAQTPPHGAGPDDLLDAAALALVARRVQAGTAVSYPDPPERDRFAIAIAIWA